MKQRLRKMKPIIVPASNMVKKQDSVQEKQDKSKDDISSADDLSKRLIDLRNKINKNITNNRVVDIKASKTCEETPEIPAFVLTSKIPNKNLVRKELKQETDNLKLEIARLISSRTPGGQIQADFAEFPTPLMAKSMLEKDCKLVARVKLAPKAVKSVPLIIGSGDLKRIHQTVLV